MPENKPLQKWKVLSSEVAFDSPWFPLRKDTIQLPNGKIIDDFYVWDTNGTALVIPQLRNGKIVLTQQYRHGLGDIAYEFPGGYIDDGEAIEHAIIRELREESGLASSEILPLGVFRYHSTKETGAVHAFVAKNCEYTHEQEFDPTEDIRLVEKTPEEVNDMILNGEIIATGAISAFYLFLNNE